VNGTHLRRANLHTTRYSCWTPQSCSQVAFFRWIVFVSCVDAWLLACYEIFVGICWIVDMCFYFCKHHLWVEIVVLPEEAVTIFLCHLHGFIAASPPSFWHAAAELDGTECHHQTQDGGRWKQEQPAPGIDHCSRIRRPNPLSLSILWRELPLVSCCHHTCCQASKGLSAPFYNDERIVFFCHEPVVHAWSIGRSTTEFQRNYFWTLGME